MKLKDPDNEKYIKASLAGFAAIAAGLILFFLIFRSEALGRGVDKIAGILKPFFYGAVIAYILTPLCNRIKTGLGADTGRKKTLFSQFKTGIELQFT